MDYWEVIEGLYNTTFSLFFFLLAIVMFFIARKGYRSDNQYGCISTSLTAILFIVFGYFNSITPFFPFPYSGFFVWWIGFNLIFNVIFFWMIKRVKKKISLKKGNFNSKMGIIERESILERYILRMTKGNPYREDISLKMEYIRKSFHLMGLLILVAYYGFFFIPPVTQLISDGVILLIQQVEPSYNFLWGSILDFPYVMGDPRAIIDLTMMALIGSLVFALVSDVVRIIWGPEYSIFNFLTKSMLRKKELNAAGPQIYIITGFVFSFMFYMIGIIDILVFFAGIIIACLSDASAALIGRKYGKHKIKFRKRGLKSLEGFLAGTIVAYLIGLIFVGPFYAIVGAIIFFMTDYFPTYIADNILNPIFIPIGIQLFIFLLGLPVGWF
jgi:dolichol kinase